MLLLIYCPRPIHDAIEGDSLEIVKLLVESGADISVEREGKTLINIAEEHGFKEIIDYLEGLSQLAIATSVHACAIASYIECPIATSI